MNQRSAKKLRREVAKQYAKQEAAMRGRVIEAIGEMPLWRRIIVAWRIVDKSPLLSEAHLWLWQVIKRSSLFIVRATARI